MLAANQTIASTDGNMANLLNADMDDFFRFLEKETGVLANSGTTAADNTMDHMAFNNEMALNNHMAFINHTAFDTQMAYDNQMDFNFQMASNTDIATEDLYDVMLAFEQTIASSHAVEDNGNMSNLLDANVDDFPGFLEEETGKSREHEISPMNS
ncbi:hypothetical protein M419DRAFT_10622 [Trichoderma reesei RUT C-30]|uniref:Uncharacterized protein n=1 Tax=Hypocrea jecorina (strain ATCC 56765 / BCRC 32924 / NRRL 11460 / Rut C-30) TaxID=1344414 RepID=A0A024S634_HYPJR|nr:hypothetical protein M419DRAFT_10622 [Trichoderma reesei RUT C-30]